MIDTVAAVLAVWCVVGLVFAIYRFDEALQEEIYQGRAEIIWVPAAMVVLCTVAGPLNWYWYEKGHGL